MKIPGKVGAGAIALAALTLGASGVPPPKWGTVSLPSGKSLNVEIADTPLLEERGYMYRDRVPEGEGMIFLLASLDIHPFWMKNCRTGLDILWIDENWRIVHIAPEVPPCPSDPCPTYSPLQMSHYVLEVGPGQAGRLGLKIGDHITYLPPTNPKP